MSAPLALHNPERLFICRTKKAFHSQPRKLYLTCTWYGLIFLKYVSIHSRTARWPVIYLESKEHRHDRGSKDFLITLLMYMSLICSPWCLSPCPTSFNHLESELKCAGSYKWWVLENVWAALIILLSFDTSGGNYLNWIWIPGSGGWPTANHPCNNLYADFTAL